MEPGANLAKPPPPLSYTPPSSPLRIIYSDEAIIVIDKPSGLLTVPGKAEAHRDCLESRIQRDFPEARIVHRLDMDTSGVVILAMNAAAHRHLGLQFERRHVEKAYIADLYGVLQAPSGEIDLPLRCDWPNRPRQMVDLNEGRAAFTRFEVISRSKASTRVRLFPKTGRSHQLRVHTLELGHPILGDPLYAHEAALSAAPRLALHAERLSVYHPVGGRRLTFESPVPF
ncbi:MAG: pseudouridine synthase [Pseudomonadota bacterium]